MTISNPKLVDLGPTWAPFRGWSVLFTPRPELGRDPAPTAAATAPAGVVRLDDAGHDPSVATTYDELAAWVDDRARAAPSTVPEVAVLPRSTYHVTVCDGLSDGVLTSVDRRVRPRVEAVLDRLPAIVSDADAVAPGAGSLVEQLTSAARRPIGLHVESVCARGHAVVAELTADTASSGAFTSVEQRRRELLDALGSELGLHLTTRWRPHVTLAYAATPDDATRWVAAVGRSAEHLVDELGRRVVRFDWADVVAFDDMVTFWRRR